MTMKKAVLIAMRLVVTRTFGVRTTSARLNCSTRPAGSSAVGGARPTFSRRLFDLLQSEAEQADMDIFASHPDSSRLANALSLGRECDSTFARSWKTI